MNFPVSIKGVLVEAGRVALLENERDEWELPGGRLEPGEAPETCLAREFARNWVLWWTSRESSTAGFTRFCLGARLSSSPTVWSAAIGKNCVSAMNIGDLGFSRFTKSKRCRYRKDTAVQYAHGLHDPISTGRQ